MVHLKSKCVSTKRAILIANSCPRKSFGFDGNRLRFLYPSTVEPILSYGCSVWLLALKSKAGENTIRSFQRFAARLITRTFKTVFSESLLVLTNLLPLDLKLLKLVGSRYLSTKMEDCFSPSSFKCWSLVLHSSSATLGLLCLINFTIMITPLGMLIPSSTT
jgi:hypothetical protein